MCPHMDYHLIWFRPLAIAAKDKEITSLCKNILTELGPESPDWDQAQRQATSCRMLLAIKRDGTVKCRLVKQGFKENLLEVDGPDFLYSSNVVKLHTVRMLLSRDAGLSWPPSAPMAAAPTDVEACSGPQNSTPACLHLRKRKSCCL